MKHLSSSNKLVNEKYIKKTIKFYLIENADCRMDSELISLTVTQAERLLECCETLILQSDSSQT